MNPAATSLDADATDNAASPHPSVGTPYILMSAAYVLIRVLFFIGTAPSKAQDTLSYLDVTKLDVLSWDFLAGPRGWTVPLFYKLIGDDQLRIYGQLAISISCWLLLAAVTALILSRRGVSFAGFATILVFSLPSQIVGWDSFLISDSLSLSLSAALVAAWLWFVWKPTPVGSAGLICMSLLWVFARDTNALPVLAAGLAAIAAIGFSRRRRILAITGGGLIVVFVLAVLSMDGGATADQRQAALSGSPLGADSFGREPAAYRLPAQQYQLFSDGRWEFPLLNVIGTRILTSPERLNYFRDHGMPVNPELLSLAGGMAAAKNGAFYRSPKLAAFRSWLQDHGQTTYVRYLLTHPSYTLSPLWHKDAVRTLFFPEVDLADNSYPLDPHEPVQAVDSALPGFVSRAILGPSIFGAAFWLLVLVATLVLVLRRRPTRLWSVPLFLILAAVPSALLVWHGDAQDIQRHALGMALLSRLGLVLLCLLALDSPTSSEPIWRRTRPLAPARPEPSPNP